MFKAAKDFGGYWVKNVKNFKGHEQEPLFQCSVYKDNKKIGFFSEDSFGGQAMLDCPKQEDSNELERFAKEFEGEKAWGESYHTFIGKIVEETDSIRYFKRLCKTKLVFKSVKPSDNYYAFDLKRVGSRSWDELHTRTETDKGEKFYLVNRELEKL